MHGIFAVRVDGPGLEGHRGVASLGLWVWNSQWTSGVQSFPEGSGFASLVVTDGYQYWVMLIMLGIGALAGAIGAGIAASRFLDV